jgi:hypothetical protein
MQIKPWSYPVTYLLRSLLCPIHLKTIRINSYAFVIHCFLTCLSISVNTAYAVDTTVLDVGTIAGKGWKLEGVKLAITKLNQKQPQFKLSATKLALPKPFYDLSLANITCNHFAWKHDEIECKQGKASVNSTYWQSPETKFYIRLGNNKNTIRFEDARLMGGLLALEADSDGENWQCKLKAGQMNKALIDKLLLLNPALAKTAKSQQAPIKSGSFIINGVITGRQNAVHGFSLNTEIKQLTGQTIDGKVASEQLVLRTRLEGNKRKGDTWFWQSDSRMTGGAIYIDPVYLEAGTQPISLKTQGVWNTRTKIANIQAFTYQHPDVGNLSGNAVAYYRDGIKIDRAELALQSYNLQNLTTTYVNPFYTESPLTGLTINGKLDAKFSFIQQKLTDAALQFNKLNVNDEAGRLAIREGSGAINWSNDATQTKQSDLAWQQLTIKGLPFEAARLGLLSQGNRFALADKVKLPLLNGSINVDKFSWQGNKLDEPDVSFAGSVDNVSLEQLSRALGWTILSGNISGQIPGVEYHGKTLTLAGGLSINVFDGAVKVNHLSSSGLFSSFPRITGDIQIENLDLDQITKKFEFGNITGRLSGEINQLVLENWHPVTFIAWLETPENDDSAHTINQKAVNNIASIGGGASNLLSRSFLSMFDTFRYDKIGFGCYLNKGSCQMMGMQPSGEQYYLIKGGGLPRIDVVGYNSRINWDVLVERLSRLASTDNVVVE